MAATTRFPMSERKTVLLGLRAPQLALAAAGVVAGALAVFGSAPALTRLALACAAAGCGTAAILRIAGIPAYRWLLLRAAHVVRRDSRQAGYHARPLKPSRAGVLHLPGTAASFKVMRTQSGHAVVHDPHHHRLTMVARIHHPAHLLQDTSEQQRRTNAWGRVIAGLCQGNRIARAQIIERTLPDSGDALTGWANSRGLDESTWQGQVYRELLEHAAPASARHETLLGLCLDLRRVGSETRQHGRGLVGASAVLEAEARRLESALHAAGITGTWLNAGQVAMVTRSAFDPAAFCGNHTGELTPAQAGPMAVEEEWDHLRSDQAIHRVYQVAEWPRLEVDSGFLAPLLLHPGIRRTFSLVLQPIRFDKALRDARRDRVNRITDKTTRARLGQLESELDRQADRDVDQREIDLTAGHGDVRWVGLLAVTADHKDQLEEACRQLETAATQSMLDLRRLVGQQAEAFLAATLPFGTALD